MLTVWACFLHKGLSFLEKKAWPSRLAEQTCGESKLCYSLFNVSIFSFLEFKSHPPLAVKLSALTYRTHKAGVMPGESQSIQELIPCLDGEVTPVAVGPKQVVVVWLSNALKTFMLILVCLYAKLSWCTLVWATLLYLVHSMVVHPPCGTCCLWLAAGRQCTRNRTHARSVSEHSSPPAEKTQMSDSPYFYSLNPINGFFQTTQKTML